jgi:DUF4097 and DUF4098 domain-containing protein YvlB
MKHFIIISLAVVFAFSIAGEAVCKELNKDFHQSFDVKQGYRLKLKSGDGDVTITPWDKDVLDVKVVYRATYRSIGVGGERDFEVVFNEKGSTIEVIGKEKGFGGIGIHYFNEREYTYTIQAPSYMELQLDGDDGDVEITGWEGDIQCDMDDGDLDLDNVSAAETRIRLEDGDTRIEGHSGRLMIQASDGDITIMDSDLSLCRISLEDGDAKIDQSRGEFEVEIDDGDITFRRLTSNSIDIESEDGDIDVDLAESDVIDVEIRTDDGSVTVYLPGDASAAFTIDVDDGEIDVEMSALEVFEKKNGWMAGRIRDGRGQIKIRTSDGDVTLREAR